MGKKNKSKAKDKTKSLSRDVQKFAAEAKALQKAERAAMRMDEVIRSNVYGDFHRMAYDQLDSVLASPTDPDPLSLPELARLTTKVMVEDAAEHVALQWRDLEGRVDEDAHGLTIEEWRQKAIKDVRADLEETLPHIRAAALTHTLDFYSECAGPRDRLKPNALKEALDMGADRGERIINLIFNEISHDNPGGDHDNARQERQAGLEESWNITRFHIKKCVPATQRGLPQDPVKLYKLASLDVAQNALHDAFNIAAYGTRTKPADAQAAAPRSFAGAIMSELGIAQRCIEVKTDGPKDPNGYLDLANGDLAETPRALQIREMSMVVNAIAEDIYSGRLNKQVKRRFVELSEKARPGHNPASLPRAARDKTMATVDNMMENILCDFRVAYKRSDGWAISDSAITSPEQKRDFVTPLIAQTAPHTLTLH